MAICVSEQEVYNMGKFAHCRKVNTPVIADVTGIYSAVWEFRGALIRTEIAATAGNALMIDACVFNEQSSNTVEFYKPDGTLQVQSLTADNESTVDFTKFKLTVMPGFKVIPDTDDDLTDLPQTNVAVSGTAAYSSHAAAAAAGVQIGEWYEVGPAHDEGAVEGTVIKRIV